MNRPVSAIDRSAIFPAVRSRVCARPAITAPRRSPLISASIIAVAEPPVTSDTTEDNPGRLDELGGLLFREPQQLLDPGAEAGIGGALLLLDLAAGFGQLPLQGRGLLAVLADFGFDLPDVLINLVAVVAAHHRRELTRRGLPGEAGQLGVNVRLHGA